jgi:hypothetical protein
MIDANAPALLGTPLVWYNHHDRTCAALPPHIHALWKKGEIYRVSLLLNNWQQDEGYKRKMSELSQRLLDLCDLLALLLAQEHRYDTESIEESDLDGGGRSYLSIGPHEHLSISPAVCDILIPLEEARAQLDQDMEALAGEQKDEVLHLARGVLERLYEMGLALGHPTLLPPADDLDDNFLLPQTYNDWGIDTTRHLASFARAGREETAPIAIQWGWRHPRDSGGDFASIEALLRTHEKALAALLAERIVQLHFRQVQEQARSLAKSLGITIPDELHREASGGEIVLLPLTAVNVWELYKAGQGHLETYTDAWRRLYDQIMALEQVFIDA